MAAKSRGSGSAPWQVELVFELPLLSTQAAGRRGRAKMDVCHVTESGRTVCRKWKAVRYRQYDGRSRTYVVYQVTAAVKQSWSVCSPSQCRSHLPYHAITII